MSFSIRNIAETQGTTQPPSPKVGDQHFDTVTGITYRCRVADAWEAVATPSAFGHLYEDSAGTVITLTTGGTFYQWVSSVAGDSNLVTLSTANDNMTIDTAGGSTYLVQFQVSLIGSAAEIYHWAVFVDNTEQIHIGSERKVSATDYGSQSATGLVVLSDSEVVDLRVSATSNSKTATVKHAQLIVTRIG